MCVFCPKWILAPALPTVMCVCLIDFRICLVIVFVSVSSPWNLAYEHRLLATLPEVSSSFVIMRILAMAPGRPWGGRAVSTALETFMCVGMYAQVYPKTGPGVML